MEQIQVALMRTPEADVTVTGTLEILAAMGIGGLQLKVMQYFPGVADFHSEAAKFPKELPTKKADSQSAA